MSDEEIADELGVSMNRLADFARELSLPVRQCVRIYLPSQEQIAQEAAIIRASWSRQERESRLRGVPRDRIEFATGVQNNGRTDAGGASADGRKGGGPPDAPEER